MYLPRLSTLLACLLVMLVASSVYNITRIFTVLECAEEPCYTYALASAPKLQLALFTSVQPEPNARDVTAIWLAPHFDYQSSFERDYTIDMPARTRRNGTLYLHVAVSAADGPPLAWRTLARQSLLGLHTTELTGYHSVSAAPATTHLRSRVHITLLVDAISIAQQRVPVEMLHQFHVDRQRRIMPMLRTDFFHTRNKHFVPLSRSDARAKFTLHYQPIGIGKLRLMLLVESAVRELATLGFRDKEFDDVKGIFADTNMYWLCGTLIIISVHILLDFLSFKNDVSFWRRKSSYAGLSTRTTLWRAFSQLIIFLYLFNEQTSLLILVPSGVSLLIELWKCKKILRIQLRTASRQQQQQQQQQSTASLAEQRTMAFDKEGMRYLSYLLYPLCIGLALYSCIYEPQRGWYSWTLNSLVNGVYAFGFLFMLPQLFINYKLKSVAALPWRAFMYKAFNTFIDDVFAFMITMPTSHRIACFRDDVVFVIYLYQRWLYPVDESRLDDGRDDGELIAVPAANQASKSGKAKQS